MSAVTGVAEHRREEEPMKALVYHGPGEKSWETVADPKPMDPTDIVVQIDTTTICGTDLHILKGDVPTVEPGRILGHEAVGTVVAVGTAVTGLKVDDRVIVPAITSCGRCAYCKRGMPSHCQGTGGIGWIFGHLIDGTQAEYARVPFAETSVHKVPDGVTDQQVLFLTDILPTGYEVGVRNGRVKPGDVVVVVGAGPVGLAAIQTAELAGAATVVAVDVADSRLEHAVRFGADHVLNSAGGNIEELIASLTDDGLGADVAIEAVGIPETFDLCTRVVRPGGVVANIGVHGHPTTLHLEDLWINNVTITTGLVDGTTVPMLMKLVQSGKIAGDLFGTHEFALDDMLSAYDTFAEAGANNALKVVIRR
ncbi:alcohol dehydrogenase catalytic domain-containing protein [Pseudonocardia sp. CA-142604]|uniref:alcohol dehydrogenase catalytic domain-containing protein n=1 Tax=Pseudonocardia sp. CA-142604 TaxID=3240024 RepID=UPI003D8B262E